MVCFPLQETETRLAPFLDPVGTGSHKGLRWFKLEMRTRVQSMALRARPEGSNCRSSGGASSGFTLLEPAAARKSGSELEAQA